MPGALHNIRLGAGDFLLRWGFLGFPESVLQQFCDVLGLRLLSGAGSGARTFGAWSDMYSPSTTSRMIIARLVIPDPEACICRLKSGACAVVDSEGLHDESNYQQRNRTILIADKLTVPNTESKSRHSKTTSTFRPHEAVGFSRRLRR